MRLAVTKDEFTALPAPLALGVLYEIARSKLEPIPAPAVPRPPKWDGRLARSGGFWWMSEMDLNSLEFWAGKKRESVASGGQYAEKDAKTVAAMEKWITWRRLFPYATWSGKRGEDAATGAPPSRNPQLNKWTERQQTNGAGGSSSTDSKPKDDDFQF